MRKKWNRVGAAIIDFSICLSLIKLIFIIIAFTSLSQIFALTAQTNPENANLLIDLVKMYLYMAVCVAIFVGYNTLTFSKIKGTFGKLILRIHIIDEKTATKKEIKPTTKQIAKREYYKWLFFYATFGLYGIYSIILIIIKDTEKKEKRLYHDKKAGTITEVWI